MLIKKCNTGRMIDQWDRIEKPSIDLHIHGQQIFAKRTKAIQGREDGLFNKWCLSYWISIGKNK